MAEGNAFEGAESEHLEVGSNVMAILQVIQVKGIKVPDVAVPHTFFDIFSQTEKTNVGFVCWCLLVVA